MWNAPSLLTLRFTIGWYKRDGCDRGLHDCNSRDYCVPLCLGHLYPVHGPIPICVCPLPPRGYRLVTSPSRASSCTFSRLVQTSILRLNSICWVLRDLLQNDYEYEADGHLKKWFREHWSVLEKKQEVVRCDRVLYLCGLCYHSPPLVLARLVLHLSPSDSPVYKGRSNNSKPPRVSMPSGLLPSKARNNPLCP